MSLLIPLLLLPLLSFGLPSSNTLAFPSRTLNHPHVMTYYADWAPPESFDCSLFDVIIFAFALPDASLQLTWDSKEAPALLSKLVPAAHAKFSLVMLSIGGWTGSSHFSAAVATPQNRDDFTNNILELYKQYDLDGIDIDWEYPGQSGQPGNEESPVDSANMLQFFKDLRRKLPSNAMISAAVSDSTFIGQDGQPMQDVSSFSDVLNWVTLMNYDVHQTNPPPGPNAPLSDGCHNSSQPNENAVSAYNAWTSAGFSPSKIVLGVPAYGYIVDSNAPNLSQRSPTRAYSDDGSGQIQFNSLIAQGILVQEPDGSFQGSGGFNRRWDNCSATPYLHSDKYHQVIPYDDDVSLGIKAAWVRDMGMGGVNLFDAHGDTSEHDLTHALRAALFPNTSPSTSVPLPSRTVISPSSIGPSTNTVPAERASQSTSAPSSPLLGSIMFF